MDSKKRLFEIRIWDQEFFVELSPEEKLLYFFMISNCDNVGVYAHSPKLAKFHCGTDIEIQSLIEKVNKDEVRIETLSNKKLWIKDIVRICWGTIAARNNLGRSCYKLLIEHNLLERFISEFPTEINVDSFRDAIMNKVKGYTDLPLPPACPKADPGQTQVKNREATNNKNNIINGNKSTNHNSSGSNTSTHNEKESPIDFEKRSRATIKGLKDKDLYKEMGLDGERGELPFK